MEAPELTGCAAVQQEIAKYSNWDANIMQAIARSENRGCDPLNHNLSGTENHKVCTGSYGVLQVGCLHFFSGEDRDDLATQVAVANRVFIKQGYRAWSDYKNGNYLRFLK